MWLVSVLFLPVPASVLVADNFCSALDALAHLMRMAPEAVVSCCILSKKNCLLALPLCCNTYTFLLSSSPLPYLPALNPHLAALQLAPSPPDSALSDNDLIKDHRTAKAGTLAFVRTVLSNSSALPGALRIEVRLGPSNLPPYQPTFYISLTH